MPVVEQSPFRAAFLNMKVTPKTMETHKGLIQSTSRLLVQHAGTRRIPDWNAHLKLKTYRTLVREKVMIDKSAPQEEAAPTTKGVQS